MRLLSFLDEVSQWAEDSQEVVGLALVGSHARNAARRDSDVDLVVLCTDPDSLIHDRDWTRQFGDVREIRTEHYGAVCSLRVFYDDRLEVEFGLAESSWARVPLDDGTKRVISNGIRILYDPIGLFSKAKEAAAAYMSRQTQL